MGVSPPRREDHSPTLHGPHLYGLLGELQFTTFFHRVEKHHTGQVPALCKGVTGHVVMVGSVIALPRFVFQDVVSLLDAERWEVVGTRHFIEVMGKAIFNKGENLCVFRRHTPCSEIKLLGITVCLNDFIFAG